MSLDETLVTALREDYTKLDLEKKDRLMLDYVADLTKHAYRLTPERQQELKEVGFSEEAILQITCLASWFNYVNRMADALGVGR